MAIFRAPLAAGAAMMSASLNVRRYARTEDDSNMSAPLKWASPCMLKMMYGLSDVDTNAADQRVLRSYSYDRLQQCIQADVTGEVAKSLDAEVDIDPWLTKESPYWPAYAKLLPQYDATMTTKKEFEARGLIPGSIAPELLKKVNRLPFVEHFLSMGPMWSCSAPRGALEMTHLLIHTLPELGLPRIFDMRRILDAGCGTGFIVAALALHAGPNTEVVCLEYLKWVHKIASRITERGDVYDPQALPDGTPEAAILKKIHHEWGNALTMQANGTNEKLSSDFDLILIGISIPNEGVPKSVQDALTEGGVLVCPQCAPPPVGVAKQKAADPTGAFYCVGQFRVYQKRKGRLVEVDYGYSVPSFFMMPF